MCPWREQPTTDTAEILSVKVFLIINAGPLHTGSTPGCLWTATTFHSLAAMNYSHRTCSHAHTYMPVDKRVQGRARGGHMEASVLTNENNATAVRTKRFPMTPRICWNAGRLICSIYHLDAQRRGNCARMHRNKRPPRSLCMLSDAHTCASANRQWVPERTQAICDVSYVRCILSGCQQAVTESSCAANSPHLLQIIKYAFKMSLSPGRAKTEATNRCTLVVQLTLSWTPLLPHTCSVFLALLSLPSSFLFLFLYFSPFLPPCPYPLFFILSPLSKSSPISHPPSLFFVTSPLSSPPLPPNL